MPADPSNVPLPPGLHWTIVLLLDIVTLGLFGYVWAIVQALWARKSDRSSKALGLYIIAIALSVAGCILEFFNASVPIQALIQIAAILVATFGAFSVRDSLADYITGVTGTRTWLSGLMTIFFGEVYLQYHMNRVRSFQRHPTLARAQ
jgi:hypothetical protein